MMLRLLDVSPGSSARVVEFNGGKVLCRKLTHFGIYPGDCLRMVRKAPLGGPLLIICNEREIALGRGVAEKIIVELSPCDSH
jgi:ferrous iron transport protein A